MGETKEPQHAPPRNSVEQMAAYMVPGSAFNMLRNLEVMLRILLSWSTVTLDVFVRREFGERYLTLSRVIIGLLTIRFFLMLANIQTAFDWLPGVRPLASERTINQWYLICFTLLALLHLARIWQRNHAGRPYHSYSFGLSWLDFLTALPPLRIGRFQFQVTDWMLYRFIEPGLCLTVAWYMLPGPSFTRSWLIWASLAMLVHNNAVYSSRRGRFLDMLDGHIESGYYNQMRSEALGESAAYKAVGYAVMPLPPLPESVHEVDMQATVAETMGRPVQSESSDIAKENA
jgi:hypothetical protein